MQSTETTLITGARTGERNLASQSALIRITERAVGCRFDLTSGKLVTFSYSTEEKSLVDGRKYQQAFYEYSKSPPVANIDSFIGRLGPFMCMSGKLFYSTSSSADRISTSPSTGWFAIRDAWPTWNIPHPDHLAQKTQRVITPESSKDDNALMAANCGRNLMLGWKPDQTTDLKKMRNNIWNEVSGREANAI